jgi:hypothetical protein
MSSFVNYFAPLAQDERTPIAREPVKNPIRNRRSIARVARRRAIERQRTNDAQVEHNESLTRNISSNPSAWIKEECFPPGFPWADPSKIRSSQVFELLDHWRRREKDQLTPLIWNPSCELLADVDQLSQNIQNLQQTHTSHSHSNEKDDHESSSDSDREEEDFTAELDKIFTEPSSLSSSPSSHFRHPSFGGTGTLASRESTHSGMESPDTPAQPSFRIRSCESYNSFNMFIIHLISVSISR